jgi:Homeodomain-like domain
MPDDDGSGRRVWPAEVRAQVVRDVYLGDSIRAVARRYAVPRATVTRWWLKDRPARPDYIREEEEIGLLVLRYVKEMLEGLATAGRVAQEERWWREAGPDRSAAFIGTAHDRVFRIIGAMAEHARRRYEGQRGDPDAPDAFSSLPDRSPGD